MKLKRKLLITAILVSVAAMSGCATHSDRIGMTGEAESTQTYAQAYQPAREMLDSGKVEDLRAKMLENDKTADGKVLTNEEMKEKLLETAGELAILERALLALNAGSPERARFFFDVAEEKQAKTESSGVTGALSSFGKSGAAVLTGAEEMRNYELRGYEKVMLLNYKSLTYLLTGDTEKAYNVARRAIDVQQEEHEKFEKELAALKEKGEEAKESGTEVTKELGKYKNEILKDANSTMSSADVKKAKLVKSAYVNPFGDYMDALILELDAIGQQAADLGSAKTAYKKALENNPSCGAAKEGVNNVEKGVPEGKKIVQVILSDGFSPVREEKTAKFKVGTYAGEIHYADLESQPTNFGSASVSVGGQTKKMSSLTKMESLIYRDELDRMPWRQAMFFAAFARHVAAGIAQAAAEKKAGVFGTLAGNMVSKTIGAAQHPDTRSWMTLPNQIMVARFIVPANQQSLTITTYNKAGGKLASKSVKLEGTDSTVVYATSYNKNLTVSEFQKKSKQEN